MYSTYFHLNKHVFLVENFATKISALRWLRRAMYRAKVFKPKQTPGRTAWGFWLSSGIFLL
jgi:hypothetical protein